MQLFNESRLLKCFNFETVLFEWKHSKYFLFKRKQITRVFEPFIFKYSNKTNRQTITAAWSLCGSGLSASSLHPYCDIPLWWAFAEEAAARLFGMVSVAAEGIRGNSEPSAGGWRCLEADQPLCWGWEVSALGMRPLCCELGVGGHEQVKMLRAQWVHLGDFRRPGRTSLWACQYVPCALSLFSFPPYISAVVCCKCQSLACFTH